MAGLAEEGTKFDIQQLNAKFSDICRVLDLLNSYDEGFYGSVKSHRDIFADEGFYGSVKSHRHIFAYNGFEKPPATASLDVVQHALDVVQQAQSKTGSRRNVTAQMMKNLKSLGEREPAKYAEKAAKCMSPKCSPRRIQQPR